MNKLPLVSITLITWNSGNIIENTLKKILETNYENYEIIIVDNGSTDETARIIMEKFPGVKLFQLPKNFNILARNISFINASGKYIIIFDADSYPESPETIRRIVNHFESDKSLGVVACLIKGGRFTNEEVPENKNAITFIGCGAGIRKEVFDKSGYYDEDFVQYYNEYDLSLRVLDAGYKIGHFKDIVVIHEHKNLNLFRWHFYAARNQVWVLIKYFPLLWLPLLIFRSWFRVCKWSYKRYGFAGFYYRQKGFLSGLLKFWPAIKKRQQLSKLTLKLYIGKRKTLKPLIYKKPLIFDL